MDGTDGAYYADDGQQILLRMLSGPDEYMSVSHRDCMYVANKLRYRDPMRDARSWFSTIRDLMLAGF